MSIHAYMMVELPAAIGRSNGNSNNHTNNGLIYSARNDMNKVICRPHSALPQSRSDKLLPTMMSSGQRFDTNKNDDSSSSCLTCNQSLKDKFGLKIKTEKPSFNSLPILLSAFEEEMSMLSLRKENEKNDKLALQSIQTAKASRTAFLSDTWRKNNGTLSKYASDSKIAEEHMLSIRPIIGKESQLSFDSMNSEPIQVALNSRDDIDDNAPASNIDNDPNDNQSELIRRKSNPNPILSTGNQPIGQLLKDRSKSSSRFH
jgi:hypothetical protein